ncbi:unnamed protein product [Jaminaea pallidilutea]
MNEFNQGTSSRPSNSGLAPPQGVQRTLSDGSNRSGASHARPAPPPAMPHQDAGPMSVAMDAGDPVIGDLLYRLDDEQQERGHGATSQANGDEEARPGQTGAAGSSGTDDHLEWMQDQPWWKRPDQWWLIPLGTLLAIASGSIASSKLELFTQIVCEDLLGAPAENSVDPLRFPHDRPSGTAECHKNPDVISGSADVQMKVIITMGILSAVTTGWWGGLSDRRGRTKVLALAVSGLLSADLSYMAVVMLPVASLPFGTHFMLISSVLEGLLGGLATIIAGHQAYVSDCTPAGTRARIYAQLSGFFFAGYTIGPAAGGYMAKVTDSLMTTFVFATTLHCLYIILVAFVIPESVSPERKRTAMRDYVAGINKGSRSEESNEQHETNSKALSGWRRLLIPLEPIAMLLPRPVDDSEKMQSRPAASAPARSSTPTTAPSASASHISVSHISRRRQRDWNLFWLSVAYSMIMGCMGLMTVKALYAQEVFSWGATELGLYLTAISVARVIALTLVLPVVIKYWHRPPKAVSLPQDAAGGSSQESDGLLDDQGRVARRQNSASTTRSYGATDHDQSRQLPSQHAMASEDDEDEDDGLGYAPPHAASVEELWTLRAKHLRLIHDSHFDLKLTRVSFALDCFSYLLLSLFRGRWVFIGGSCLIALGAGGTASMSSLALALLHRPHEAGKLFGAWSILSAISSTVIGPLFFTWIFRSTVKTAPQSIFWAGEAVLLIALMCTMFIRIRNPRSLPALPPRPAMKADADANRQQRRSSQA